jgi:hypothetical protein
MRILPAPPLFRHVLPVALLLLLLAPLRAGAQQPPAMTDEVIALSQQLHDAQRAHLWRVAAWGGLNLVGGLALLLATDKDAHPGRYGFALQSAAWGAVNCGIAAVWLLSGPGEPTARYAEAVRAEDGYAAILLLNLGLNVAYSAVGTTLVVASHRGLDNARSLRGHGTALIVQGLGLFILDGLAYLGSRDRLGQLFDLPEGLSLHAAPGTFGAVLTL